MKLACFAFGLFAAGFLAHWVVWRIRIPQRQSAALLAILLAALVVGLVAAPSIPALQDWRPTGFWQMLHVAVFHVAMALAYVVAYSALEARSPSMTLLTHVADAGPRGRTQDELFAVLGGMTPIESRLAAMTRDQMIVVEASSYRVTSKGEAWARTFGSWRRLIRLQKGG